MRILFQHFYVQAYIHYSFRKTPETVFPSLHGQKRKFRNFQLYHSVHLEPCSFEGLKCQGLNQTLSPFFHYNLLLPLQFQTLQQLQQW